MGCGKIADAHVEEIQKLQTASLVSVCDLEPIMAEQLAVRYGIPAQYSDFDRMLAEQRLDVLHITTPPQSHVALVRKSMDAGCHVYLEKPVALTYEQTCLITEIAERANLKLTVNYWPNFDPPGAILHSLAAAGALGDIIHVESYLGYDLTGAFGQAILADSNHWVHRLPGKLFHNNLDHILNKIVPFLPDLDTDVRAIAFRRRNLAGSPTDLMMDELRIMLRSGTVSAYASFSSHARPVGHFVRVYGTKKTVHADFNLRTVVFDGEQIFPSAIGRLMPPFQQGLRYIRQGARNIRAFGASRFHFFRGMTELISAFYHAIEKDAVPPIPYSEIRRTSFLMDEVIRQIQPDDRPVSPQVLAGSSA